MPDAPQRIATDTSQKIVYTIWETIKGYIERKGLNLDELVLIPLVLAGYARYLRGIDDVGNKFEPSPDPLLDELQKIVSGLEIKQRKQEFTWQKQLYSREDIFGVNLYEIGLGKELSLWQQNYLPEQVQ